MIEPILSTPRCALSNNGFVISPGSLLLGFEVRCLEYLRDCLSHAAAFLACSEGTDYADGASLEPQKHCGRGRLFRLRNVSPVLILLFSIGRDYQSPH